MEIIILAKIVCTGIWMPHKLLHSKHSSGIFQYTLGDICNAFIFQLRPLCSCVEATGWYITQTEIPDPVICCFACVTYLWTSFGSCNNNNNIMILVINSVLLIESEVVQGNDKVEKLFEYKMWHGWLDRRVLCSGGKFHKLHQPFIQSTIDFIFASEMPYLHICRFIYRYWNKNNNKKKINRHCTTNQTKPKANLCIQ